MILFSVMITYMRPDGGDGPEFAVRMAIRANRGESLDANEKCIWQPRKAPLRIDI
jgi:hypothetical protein